MQPYKYMLQIVTYNKYQYSMSFGLVWVLVSPHIIYIHINLILLNNSNVGICNLNHILYIIFISNIKYYFSIIIY